MVLTSQVAALMDYLEMHPQLAMGRISRSMEGRSLAKMLWAECASIMNTISPGCPQKTPDEWRVFFNEYKSRTAKKSKVRARFENGDKSTIDGLKSTKSLEFSPLQERLLAILDRNADEVGDPFEGHRIDPPDDKKEFNFMASNVSNQSEEEHIPTLTQSSGESPRPSTPASSVSSYRRRPKKRHHMSNNTPTNNTNNEPSALQFDRYDYMAKTWAETLRILPNKQRIIAEKMINDVFFEAQLNTLTRETHLKVLRKSNSDLDVKNIN